ncbi:MAG TPA: DUF6338 family protein [Terracidiphilus sp.]|nr:DUF6338 family protein [Terracidiphilus sp.]
MPERIEALGILLVLLPGFACAYIVQFLAVRRKQSELDKIIEALLFSLVLYLITLPFFGNTLPLWWAPPDVGHPNLYRIGINWSHLAGLAVASITFAILYSANINRDWALWLLRKIGVTERTAGETIWNDTFQEIGGMVQVGLSGERKILGWLRYYSDEVEDSSLFLETASWLRMEEDGTETEVPIDGPGILLTKDSGIEYVMFLNWAKQKPEDEDAV